MCVAYHYLTELSVVQYIPYSSDLDDVIQVPFLSANECEAYTELITSSDRIRENPLCDAFSSSRGMILYFSIHDDLESKFRQNGLYFLYELISRIKDNECNAFVCNVLIIPSSGDTAQGLSVERHHDCTLDAKELCFPYRMYLPKCVKVLYLQLSSSFTGGELELYDFNGFKDFPSHRVVPYVGSLVTFRGDIEHGVRKYNSDDGLPRISFVLENYCVPENVIEKDMFFVE